MPEKKDDLREAAHRIWLAGLGALAAAEEEGTKLFQRLVDEGRKMETKSREDMARARATAGEAAERVKKTSGQAWSKVEGAFDERVADVLQRVGVPTRQEISDLTRRVEDLTKSVDRLRAERRGTAGKSGAAKGGGRKK